MFRNYEVAVTKAFTLRESLLRSILVMHPTQHAPVQLILSTQFQTSIKKGPMLDDDEEIDDKDEKGGGADELLRDFQYALRCQFMERARNLRASCLMTE